MLTPSAYGTTQLARDHRSGEVSEEGSGTEQSTRSSIEGRPRTGISGTRGGLDAG